MKNQTVKKKFIKPEGTGTAAKGYREYKPSLQLEPYVKCLWSFNSGPDPRFMASCDNNRIILPDGCLDIIFNFADTAFDRAFIIGAMTRPVENRQKNLIGIRFRSGMAFSFLKVPINHITDKTIDLIDIWGKDSNNFIDKLLETDCIFNRLSIIQMELESKLKNIELPDLQIRLAVNLMKKSGGTLSVNKVSSLIGISRQHLKRKFDQYTGLTPKFLSKVFRFKRLLEKAKAADIIDWGSIASEAGYYDQAHMISDFKEMTGFTPSLYFNSFGQRHR